VTRQGVRGISDDRLGRAVVMLQRESYSMPEISKLLAIPEERLAKLRRDYTWTNGSPRWWSCVRIENAVMRWAKENGRWPVSRDFNAANRLPSRNVVAEHDGMRSWNGPSRQHRCRSVQLDDGSWSEWSNGWGRDVVRPTLYERIALRAKEELPVPLLLAIPNQTARRDAIVNYGGPQEIIKAGGGTLVQQDDYGKLWRLNYAEAGDWYSHYVEVVNTTIRREQRDGEWVDVYDKKGEPVYDHYFLRIPPGIWTAKDAVAWTGHFKVVRKGNPRMGPLLEKDFDGFVAQS